MSVGAEETWKHARSMPEHGMTTLATVCGEDPAKVSKCEARNLCVHFVAFTHVLAAPCTRPAMAWTSYVPRDGGQLNKTACGARASST